MRNLGQISIDLSSSPWISGGGGYTLPANTEDLLSGNNLISPNTGQNLPLLGPSEAALQALMPQSIETEVSSGFQATQQAITSSGISTPMLVAIAALFVFVLFGGSR